MKQTKLWVFSLVTLASITFLYAQQPLRNYATDEAAPPRAHEVDFKNLRLDVSFEPVIKKVKGKVTHTFVPLRQTVDSLFLDGPGITCTEALLNGKSVRMEKRNDGWMFYFQPGLKYGQSSELTISYEATPNKGIYFIGWDDPTGKCRKQIWTQGQAEDNRYWIPMYDGLNDKVVSDVTVTFPKPYYVLSNGNRVEKKELPDGQVRWRYVMPKPHATYLIMIGIGEYQVETRKSASGIPMTLLYYPDQADRVETTYRYSVEMFDYFEKEIGFPYPWGTYAQIPVQDFMYGAMENTTATVFGDFFNVDKRGYNDRNYVGVNAHELAHQWFGDLITARSPAHHWLQESFATYYNMLYEREAFGQEYFDWSRRSAALRAFGASKEDLLPIAHSRAGSARFYPKGALVLHMLREMIGREEFNRSILHYLQEHQFQNVDSHDLLNAFAEATGHSLDWFWDQWVLKGGEPEFKVSHQLISIDGKNHMAFQIRQVHGLNDLNSVFSLKTTVSVYNAAGERLVQQVYVKERETYVTMRLPDGFVPAFGLFDEGATHLRKLQYEGRTPEQWKAQARLAQNVLDRYDAVVALQSQPWESKVALYLPLLAGKTYFPIKAEMAKQALKAAEKDESARAFFLSALIDEDQQTRKEILRHMGSPMPYMADALVKQFSWDDASYDLLGMAMEALAELNDGRIDSLRKATGSLLGNRGHQYRVTWLEVGVKTKQADANDALAELVLRCGPSYYFLTRVAAWQALFRLNHLNTQMLDYAPQALQSSNTRLSGPIRQVLRDFAKQHPHASTIKEWINANANHKNLMWTAAGLEK